VKRLTTGTFFLAAAVLTVAAIAAPLWEFRMTAPQYPGEPLHIRVLTTGLSGDVKEVGTLQKFIGVNFPTALPELALVPPVFLAMAVGFALAWLAGDGRAGRVVRVTVAAAAIAVVVGSLAIVQSRLYAVGHDRDPNAPMARMKDFTPIAVGPTSVGNFTVWSYPHLGGAAFAVAAGLSVVGAWRTCTRRSAPATSRRISEVLV
jgi:hypothetical protein